MRQARQGKPGACLGAIHAKLGGRQRGGQLPAERPSAGQAAHARFVVLAGRPAILLLLLSQLLGLKESIQLGGARGFGDP